MSVCTLLLQCDQGGAGAEAVPGGAVVAQLEILCQSLRQHQSRQDSVVAGYRLHGVTAGRARGQTHVSKGPHLWRGARAQTTGSKSLFYEEFLTGEQIRGPRGCLSLDPCLPLTEHQLLSLFCFLSADL